MALFNYILYQTHHCPPRSLWTLGVSWVISLGSEAAMFFGLLNNALTGRNNFFTIELFFSLPSLIYIIIECLFIIATNLCVHCDAYKHLEMSTFVVLFHFHKCVRHEYLLN